MVEQLQGTATQRTPLPEPCMQAHLHLTKLIDQEDVEAYSHIFEVIATREAWEKERWAQVLAPFLMGDAQRAYNSLQRPQSEDYEALKSEILAHVGLSPVFAAEHFQQWTYDEHLLI